jgi:hypothetical protein
MAALLTLAGPAFGPVQNDAKSDKSRNDKTYDEDDMSGHETLLFRLISILHSGGKQASSLIQINRQRALAAALAQ